MKCNTFTLVIDITRSFSNLLWACTVLTNNFPGNFACTQWLFIFVTVVIINVFNERLQVKSQDVPLKNNQTHFSWCVIKRFTRWRDTEVNSSCSWRCILSTRWNQEVCLQLTQSKLNQNCFYDCKKCKTICDLLNALFEEQTSILTLFGRHGTNCFTKKTIYDHEAQQLSPLQQRYLHQHNQLHSNLNKKVLNHSIYGINVSTHHWQTHLTKNSFHVSFCTFSV